MTRAEEKALEAYPHFTAENMDDVIRARKFFAKGYEQAEKDLNKKPSEDLDEAAGLYLDSHKPLTRYNWGDLQDAFIAGAEWQYHQMTKSTERKGMPRQKTAYINGLGVETR